MQNPCCVPHRLTLLDIEHHQSGREAMRQVRRDVADGPALALDVEQRDATLGGGIKFEESAECENRSLNSSHTSGANPLPQAILMRCAVSFAEGAAWSR